MFCRKCGSKNEEGTKFCKHCGEQFLTTTPKVEQKKPLVDKEKMNKVKNGTKNVLTSIKNFILKYKFILGGIVGAVVIFVVAFILYNNLHDFTKLSWDQKYGDYKVEVTGPATISLKVSAYDKEDMKIKDIEFTATDGKVKADGAKVEWTLPNKDGKYTITAKTPSGKKIKKEIEVLTLEEEKSNLGGMLDLKKDEPTDSDLDGLTDEEEKKLGTNPNLKDSDSDGLSDYYETNVSKTNPLKADSDSDSLNDGNELDLGLDPLNAISLNDGIKDSERKLKYVISDTKNGIDMEINGKGNIASTTIDVLANDVISGRDGLLDDVYNFSTKGKISEVTVKINYTLEELQAKGLTEDNLTLYYFNEETKELEAVETTVDKDTKQITAKLKHFSKYVLGDSELVTNDFETQIMFVIDNSVSMYSVDQMVAAGYKNSTGAIGNDTEFKRLTVTNSMIDTFTGNYKFGIAEFSGSYVNLKEFSDDKKALKESVNGMKSIWKSSNSGTDIIEALESSIDEYEEDDNNHYIVLLTDGKNTVGSLSSKKSSIIKDAKEKEIKICVIGIGKELDTDTLEDIAEETGCKYYNATDADALDEIYSIMGSSINYNYVDTDNNGKVDGMIIADSGFITTRDGFSFANFSSNKSSNGHCYGMAVFAMLYYQDKLPMEADEYEKTDFLITTGVFKYESDGYDLEDTYFDEHKSLYDFKFTDEGLALTLYGHPSDYRDKIENETWMIKKDYVEKLEKIGATIDTEKYKGKNKSFKKYQYELLNIDAKDLSDNVSKDEDQLLSAIWRLFILQTNDKRIHSDSDSDDFYNTLKDKLNNGIPQVISINGKHGINAIRLIQDIEDANKFKIEVYDNNYPGETRYIELTREKFSKWQIDYTAWTNEYDYKAQYDSNNDGKLEDMTITINEFDLSTLKNEE